MLTMSIFEFFLTGDSFFRSLCSGKKQNLRKHGPDPQGDTSNMILAKQHVICIKDGLIYSPDQNPLR